MRSLKCIALVGSLLAACTLSRAQVSLEAEFFSLPDSISNEYLDSLTLQVQKPNDYLMVGVYGGASLDYGFFNPIRLRQFLPQFPVFGFSLVRQFTMFGVFPNMGFEVGAQLNYEGYEFKANKETGVTPDIEGATQAVMDVVELPFMLHLHTDGPHFMVAADAGIYGGYRLSIERTGDYVMDDLVHNFKDTDRRIDYGLNAGLGFGLVFDPFEFHVNANVRWSWNSIYDPDYASKDYYRFAYPFDVVVTAGLYYHLSRRSGKNRAQIRREAYEQVFHPLNNEDTGGQGR